MVITFLIGNGFDINCGLKCSYQDIYKGYIKDKDGESPEITAFKNDILRKPENWADFESAMNRYLPNFQSEDEFLRVIRDFKEYMIEHLKGEEALFLTRLKRIENGNSYKITNEMNESLNSFYEGISHNVSNKIRAKINESGYQVRFICFNYTQLADVLFKRCVNNPNVIHIHGVLNDGPVLGMDNEEQLSKEIPFETTNRFKREFIKPYFNQVYDNDRVQDAINAINASDVICVYGMSLGESDITWRDSIITWLQGGDRDLFIYDYDYSRLSVTNAHIRMDYEEEAKVIFFKRNNIGILNVPLLRNKLHIRVGQNIFNIHDVMQNVEKEIAEKEKRNKEKEESARQRSTGSMLGGINNNDTIKKTSESILTN